MKRLLLALALAAAVGPLGLNAQPGGAPEGTSRDTSGATTEDTAATKPEKAQDQRPPITVDPEAGVIDLAATIVDVEPQWLELIATTPNGREHEAIVTVAVKPSRLHLALVTLGLQPGHPMINKQDNGQVSTEPPIGPAVQVLFVYEMDGQIHETPAYDWVVDQQTGEPLPKGRWLFTGSVFRQWKGREYYMADEAGSVVSLVNFGDDLIVYQTDKTQDTDFQQLQINPDMPLPYGSELTLRIRLKPPAAQDNPSDNASTDEP